jgi:hypothetical protein
MVEYDIFRHFQWFGCHHCEINMAILPGWKHILWTSDSVRMVSGSWKKCVKWVGQDRMLSEMFSNLYFNNTYSKPLVISMLADAYGGYWYTYKCVSDCNRLIVGISFPKHVLLMLIMSVITIRQQHNHLPTHHKVFRRDYPHVLEPMFLILSDRVLAYIIQTSTGNSNHVSAHQRVITDWLSPEWPNDKNNQCIMDCWVAEKWLWTVGNKSVRQSSPPCKGDSWDNFCTLSWKKKLRWAGDPPT